MLPFPIPYGMFVTVLLVAPVIVAAAKAHGRQVRMERELEGHFNVDFRADNPPWVERLWKRDRIVYWSAFALMLGLGWQAGLQTALIGGLALILLAAWALVGAFFTAGIASLARFARAVRTKPLVRAERGPWLRAAWRGSALWWGLASSLVVAWWAAALAR